jgi:phospholipid-binding lipoprotein MlaA
LSVFAISAAVLMAGAPAASGGSLVPSPVPAEAAPAPATRPEAESAPAQAEVQQEVQAQPLADNTNMESEIVVRARKRVPEDPMEKVNVQTFELIQAVDKGVVAPVAMGYKHNVPTPLRNGLRNVLRNLQEPVVFVNFLLQHKIGKAAETVGRFGTNSTFGVFGLFDVAKRKPFDLPYRVNGFAYTFGYYGVKSGPFLYLPLIGPTTLRDVTGRLLDLALLPTAVGEPFNNPYYSIPTTAVKLLDDRVQSDKHLQQARDSGDTYATIRSDYLKLRQAEIDALRGRPAVPESQKPAN